MVIESKIMEIAGKEFREKIINLKMDGYKTEPAFGKLLSLKNPFIDLLELEKLTEEELAAFVSHNYQII